MSLIEIGKSTKILILKHKIRNYFQRILLTHFSTLLKFLHKIIVSIKFYVLISSITSLTVSDISSARAIGITNPFDVPIPAPVILQFL